MFNDKPELRKLKKSTFQNMNDCSEFVLRSGFKKLYKDSPTKINHCRGTCCIFKNNNIQTGKLLKNEGKKKFKSGCQSSHLLTLSLRKNFKTVPKCFASFLSNSQSNRQAPSGP